jgi:hypothetical protein
MIKGDDFSIKSCERFSDCIPICFMLLNDKALKPHNPTKESIMSRKFIGMVQYQPIFLAIFFHPQNRQKLSKDQNLFTRH